jgi:isopentenyldiphosphate isomerase
VYFGRLKSQTKPDPAEVTDLEFLSLAELNRRIKREPGDFTYWMKHYIRHHHGEIARHIAAQSQREAS